MSRLVLIVFDRPSSAEESWEGIEGAEEIVLAPLTSDRAVVAQVTEELERAAPDIALQLMDCTASVGQEVATLRARLPGWAHDLGNRTAGRETIREALRTKDRRMTTWWMSHVVERNPYKMDLVLQIAQTHTVTACLERMRPAQVMLRVRDTGFAHALGRVISSRDIRVLLPKRTHPRTPPRLSRAVAVLLAKVALAGVARLWTTPRRPEMKGDFLFVAYFPTLDEEAARQGRLVNRIAEPLHDLLVKEGFQVDWVWIWFRSFQPRNPFAAFSLVRSLRRAGSTNMLLEACINSRVALKALQSLVRQGAAYRELRKHLDPATLIAGLSPEIGIAPLILRWIDESFIGSFAAKNLLSYTLFDELFRRLDPHTRCLYYLEMQPWEHALNAARSGRPAGTTIGFVNTSVPPNYFPYSIDTRDPRGDEGMPLPDVIACNGNYSLDAMRATGLDNVRPVEAIRHLDYSGAAPKGEGRGGSLLVVATIDEHENRAMLDLVYEAFGGDPAFPILIREHPAASCRPQLKRLPQNSYTLVEGALSDALGASFAALIGGTTVAIEALARGLPVVVPRFVDLVSLSPLEGTESVCDRVSTPQELRQVVTHILSAAPAGLEERQARGRLFAQQYWWTDPELPKWREMLSDRVP